MNASPLPNPARNPMARLLCLDALGLFLAPLAAEQVSTQINSDGPHNPDTDGKQCCPCLTVAVNKQEQTPEEDEVVSEPAIDGSRFVDVTITHSGGDNCPETISGSAWAESVDGEASKAAQDYSVSEGESVTLTFEFDVEDVRQNEDWEILVSCGDEPYCDRYPISFRLKCDACESGEQCETAGEVSGETASFTINIPTTRSNGGMTTGKLWFYTRDFSFPGRAGLRANVPSDFTVSTDSNDFITFVDTGAATIEVADVSGQDALTVRHKDPGGATFRTTTISFVNEGGVDRLRSDSVFSGTTTRIEQTEPQAGTLVTKKGHVVGGTFQPLREETLVSTEPAIGTRVYRRTIKERASTSHAWATVSDIETTWENQVHGWVKTKEVIDPGDEALTSTWTYYQPGDITGPSGSTRGLGRLKRYARHDGYEEFHTYGLYYSAVTTPYAGNVAGKTTTTTWNPANKSRTVETKVGGNTLSKTVTTFTDTTKSVAVHTSAGEALTTTTTYVPDGQDFGGMPVKVVRPDGTLATYAYTRDASTGGYTTVMEEGATSDDTTVSQGLRTTTVKNSRGTTILRTTEGIGYGTGSAAYDLMAVTSIDSLGRPLTTAWHPESASAGSGSEQASATGEAWTTSMTYNCWGVATETDRYGITTYHAYDGLQRRIKTNRIGVTTETVRNGLTTDTHRYAKSVTGSLSSTFEGTGSNLISQHARNLSGTFSWSASPDPTSGDDGDLVSTTTNIAYQPAAGLSRRVVTTTPDGFTQTEDSFLDGRTATTAGALSPDMTYGYAVGATGETVTRSYLDGTTPRETTATTGDWAGRQVGIAYMDGASATMAYNSLGQMTASTDPDGVTTLYAYNSRGERTITALDLDADGTIDYGTDSVRFSETVPALDGSSAPVWQTTSKVWQDGETDAGAGTVVSTTLRTADGLETETQSIGVANASTSLTTLTGGGNWTVRNTNPDGTYTIATYVDGLMDITESYDANQNFLASRSQNRGQSKLFDIVGWLGLMGHAT